MKRLSLLALFILLLFTNCEKTLDNTSGFEVTFLSDSTFKIQFNIDEPGMLDAFITPYLKKHIEAIKIDGRINGNDFQTIRDIWEYQEAVFGKSFFYSVDLSDCELLAGGQFVYPQKTYENVEGELVTHIDSIYVRPTLDKAIPPFAFADLWLKTITIPNTINTIEDYAFKGCEIRSFSIPNSVLEFGKGVFCCVYTQCPIEIPEGVVSLPDSMFYNASQIPSITLPTTIQTIGQFCFFDCLHLNEISVRATIPPSCDETMWNSWYTGMRVLYVPADALDAYKTHPVWGKADIIKPLNN